MKLTGKEKIIKYMKKIKWKTLGEIIEYEQPTKYIVDSKKYYKTLLRILTNENKLKYL